MKLLCLVLMVLVSNLSQGSSDLSECRQQTRDSLWTVEYECAQGSVQVGYGVVTESLAVNQDGKVRVEYSQTKKNKVNLKYLKHLKQLKQ